MIGILGLDLASLGRERGVVRPVWLRNAVYLGPVDLWLGWLLLVMHLFGRVFVYVDLLQAHLSVDKVVRVRLTLERDVWRLVSILMGKFPI